MPVAVAVLLIAPAVTSAALEVYVAVQVVCSRGARTAVGHCPAPLRPAGAVNLSLIVRPVIVTLPVVGDDKAVIHCLVAGADARRAGRPGQRQGRRGGRASLVLAGADETTTEFEFEFEVEVEVVAPAVALSVIAPASTSAWVTA